MTAPDAPALLCFPATPVQTRFWFLHQAGQDPSGHNVIARWELTGPADAGLLRRALALLLERHEILRSALAARDGLPVQELHPAEACDAASDGVALAWEDLPPGTDPARIDRRAAAHFAQVIPMDRPPLLRLLALAHPGEAPGRTTLLLVAHHAVFDGRSLGIFGAELIQTLAALHRGAAPELPELPLQYGDYALWMEDRARAGAWDSARRYWTGQLADAPYFELPADHARDTPRQAARLERGFGPDLEARLAGAARRHRLSPFALGAGICAAALGAEAGTGDVTLGATLHGRDAPELTPLIGSFINTAALRFRFGGAAGAAEAISDKALLDVLDQSRAVVAQALAHGDYPVERLVRDLARPRDPLRTPLVSCFFALDPPYLADHRAGPFAIADAVARQSAIATDVNLRLTCDGGTWVALLDYDAARFTEARMARLMDSFAALLERALTLAPRAIPAPSGTAAAHEPAPPSSDSPAAAPPAAEAPRPHLSLVDRGPGQDDIAPRLARIWAGLLDRPPAACDGDFFDLGGHSILALQMLSRVEQAFGRRPEIGDFLADPRLSAMAAWLGGPAAMPIAPPAAKGPWRGITLREGTPAGALVVTVNQPFLWHGLAGHFPGATRVMNLHLDPGDEALAAGLDIAGLAREAAAALPLGPSRRLALVGHCADGLMALEIARAVRAAGHEVSVLGLVDCWHPLAPGFGRLEKRLRRVRHYTGQALRREITWTDWLSKSARGKQLLQRLGQLAPTTEAERRERRINAALARACARHRFDPWDGQTMLLATESQPRAGFTEQFGWEGLLPAASPVHALRGWHEDSLIHHGHARLAQLLALALDAPGSGPRLHLARTDHG